MGIFVTCELFFSPLDSSENMLLVQGVFRSLFTPSSWRTAIDELMIFKWCLRNLFPSWHRSDADLLWNTEATLEVLSHIFLWIFPHGLNLLSIHVFWACVTKTPIPEVLERNRRMGGNPCPTQLALLRSGGPENLHTINCSQKQCICFEDPSAPLRTLAFISRKPAWARWSHVCCLPPAAGNTGYNYAYLITGRKTEAQRVKRPTPKMTNW